MSQCCAKLVLRSALFVSEVQAIQPGDTNDTHHGVKTDPHRGNTNDQQIHQHDDRQQKIPAGGHHILDLGKIAGRQALHALFHRTDMNEQIHRGEVQQGRKYTDLDDIQIRHAGVFRNQEGAGAHQRRHDLPPRTGGGFYTTRLGGTKAQFFHQWDRKRASGHHVRDGAAGNRAHTGRCQHRGLGRAATLTTGCRKGQVNKKATGTGDFQHGAEQYENEDERRGYTQRKAENTLLPQIQLGANPIQRIATVAKNAWQPFTQFRQRSALTTHRVNDRNNTDHREAGTYRTATCLQQGYGAHPGHDNIGLVPEPCPAGNLVKKPDQVKSRRC